MSKKTTEQQIRKHIRAAIQDIRKNINEVNIGDAGVTGGIGQVAMSGARGAASVSAGTTAAAGTAGATAGAAAVVIPVAAAVVTAVALALTQEAITQGIFAYKAGASADEAAERNMMKSAVNRAWTLSVCRRRGMDRHKSLDGCERGTAKPGGEDANSGDLEKDIAAMRSWRMSRNGTGFDADALGAAIGRITRKEWDDSPVEADPGGYGDVEDAQEKLDTFLSELPEPPDPVAADPETISEARKHVRNAINEIMVGLTPIKRIDAQRKANKARKGNNTNTAVNKADIGFNTFDMQEWASIAGIDERHLSESVSDDTGNNSMLGGDDESFDNVVDIADRRFNSSDEIEGMEDEEEDNRHDSAPYEAEGMISDMMTDIEKRHLQFKANKRGSDVDDMEAEVEDLADQLLADREDPNVVNLADEPEDLSTVFDFGDFKA